MFLVKFDKKELLNFRPPGKTCCLFAMETSRVKLWDIQAFMRTQCSSAGEERGVRLLAAGCWVKGPQSGVRLLAAASNGHMAK